MKKTIIIEIILVLVFCVLIACAIKLLAYAHYSMQFVERLQDMSLDEVTRQDISQQTKKYISTALSYGIPSLLAALATVAAGILIALKDFPVFKPFVDRLAAKHAERKQRRSEQKTAKAEENRQSRIASLQAELDELKKDE